MNVYRVTREDRKYLRLIGENLSPGDALCLGNKEKKAHPRDYVAVHVAKNEDLETIAAYRNKILVGIGGTA